GEQFGAAAGVIAFDVFEQQRRALLLENAARDGADLAVPIDLGLDAPQLALLFQARHPLPQIDKAHPCTPECCDGDGRALDRGIKSRNSPAPQWLSPANAGGEHERQGYFRSGRQSGTRYWRVERAWRAFRRSLGRKWRRGRAGGAARRPAQGAAGENRKIR